MINLDTHTQKSQPTGRLSKLIAMLFNAYDKKPDRELASLYVMRLRDIDISLLEQHVSHWIDTEKFFPKISELRECVAKQAEADETQFLLRFRQQATNPYSWAEIDEDVYTVKQHVGVPRVEDASKDQWPWIEKEAIKIYRLLKQGQLPLIENPNKDRIQVLPSGARFIALSAHDEAKQELKTLSSTLAKMEFIKCKQVLRVENNS